MSLPEVDYSKSEQTIHFLMNQVNIIGTSFQSGMIVSIVFATIFSISSIFMTLYDFQDRVLRMRVGKHTFKVEKLDYSLASDFIGSYLSNAIISFLMFAFIITLILTIILHPLFWQFLQENRVVLFGVLFGTTIIQYAFQKFFQFVLFDKEGRIKNTMLHSFFEMLLILLSLMGGFALSISRIFLLMITQLIGFFRMDQTVLPNWVHEMAYIDPANTRYFSMIMMYHHHNNPIAFTFSNYIKQALYVYQKNEDAKEFGNQQLEVD